MSRCSKAFQVSAGQPGSAALGSAASRVSGVFGISRRAHFPVFRGHQTGTAFSKEVFERDRSGPRLNFRVDNRTTAKYIVRPSKQWRFQDAVSFSRPPAGIESIRGPGRLRAASAMPASFAPPGRGAKWPRASALGPARFWRPRRRVWRSANRMELDSGDRKL